MMRRFAIGLLLGATCLVATPAPEAQAAAGNTVENTVVKVFATVRRPDPYKPWQKEPAEEVSGSGVIIEGKRILTNAHVVLWASHVQVQAYQAGDKVSATVVAVAPGIDLAVLKLDDEKVFATRPPLPRKPGLPDVKDAVMAYGYPTGGSNLSITKGIVSRIEFTAYNRPVSGLRIQIDAAINRGNSGGPAVVGDKMIGLAFSSLGGTQNIGYIIPNEEVDLFLKDVADGKYDGKPAMFDELQTLENPALRTFLKLGPEVQGIIVHEPYTRERPSPLETWDVITKIGDTKVDDQGMVQIGTNLRIRFQYLVQRLARDGKVPLTVVRAGKPMTVQLPVAPTYPMLIPDRPGEYPPYFIYGPLVFSAVTSDVMQAGFRGFGGSGVFTGPMVTRMMDPPAFAGEQLVIVPAPFLAHKIVKGYDNPAGSVVRAVNGVAIKNLRHLVEVLRDSRKDFLVFEFARQGGETFVFSRKELEAVTDEILTDNGIRSQGSPELLKIWSAKPKG